MSKTPTRIDCPSFNWGSITAYATVASALLAIVLAVLPSIHIWPTPVRVLFIFATLLVPALLTFAVFAARWSIVFWRRGRAYNEVWEFSEFCIERVEMTQTALAQQIQERAGRRAFTIDSCSHWDGTGVVIAIAKKKGTSLDIGSVLHVIDEINGALMGVFKVTEVRTNDYRASRDGIMDPIWMGYLKASPGQKIDAPPNTIAVAIDQDVTKESDHG